MKNRNEHAEEHAADETAIYRALTHAVADGEPEVVETEGLAASKKPPMTVGAYRLRRKLRQIDH